MKVFFVLLSVLVLLSSCSSKQQQEPGVKYKTLRVEFTDRTLKNGYAASLRGSMLRYARRWMASLQKFV